jgi:hypothetical protein
VKQKTKKAEKVSIEVVEPLIKSILKAKGDLTEEKICLLLGYNEGYISQQRSREKQWGTPQVSMRFYKQLETFSLQNANYDPTDSIFFVSEPKADYYHPPDFAGKTTSGQIVLVEAKDLSASYERLLEEKEARRKEAELTAQYLKEQLANAQYEKDKLFDALAKAQDVLIKNTEKIETNLNHTQDQILQLKDQTYLVSDQLARQEQALGIVTKKIPAPTSKKDKQSSVHQQDGGKKGTGD